MSGQVELQGICCAYAQNIEKDLYFAYAHFKKSIMKVAFSTEGAIIEAILESRFGRCARFLVLDSKNGTFVLLENSQNLNATQGAGIQSAQNVIASGAQALVTGHCGPKAFKVLHTAGISIYLAESKPICELIHSFEQGTLIQLMEPDVEGHW